ncbi:acyl-CoA dehydrogenase family protein [Macrococcoides caseolyticum]|uniref:acyl-CoA dehydrogenase family protein n=1 Tax=Macrococcoides caseolyticum TaxID=69966 RepID=UPI001F32F044|nr:acyl-CoA dehydrogenase family protein [Macrococcus caseolyticus]MCE4956507.1 acyl-CoA/acyl-ACP dehydrogenase [Macrococcus caseolyticus]
MEEALFLESKLERIWREKFTEHREWIEKSAQQADKTSHLNHQLIDWLIAQQYHTLTLPIEYGGMGASIKELIYIQAQLARLDESTALSIGWHLGIVGEVFEGNLWPETMMQRFIEDIKNGAIVNRIVSESEMGSPTRGGKPGTNAIREGDNFVINGTKTFASMSERLTHFIVGAFDSNLNAMCFYYVPSEIEGIEIVKTWDMVGMRATASHDIIFKDVKIPKHYLLEVNRERTPNPWLMHIPAIYLGMAERAVDEAITFCKSYQPNSINTTISEIPHIQDKLAKAEILNMQSRHFIYHACDLHLSGKTEDLAETFGLAKYIVINNGLEVIDLCMRVFGAKSLEQSRIIERLYRSMRAGLHNPPMDDAVERIIINRLLNKE